jgi:hypothetical protein
MFRCGAHPSAVLIPLPAQPCEHGMVCVSHLQDATPNTCVTVCGTSSVDACTDACQRAVCTTVHQVPAWNDNCLSRCSTECQRGRT